MTTSEGFTAQGFRSHDIGARVARPWTKRALGLRRLGVLLLAASLATGCVVNRPHDLNRARVVHPAQGLGMAIGYLVATPVMILAGLLEGIASAPYFMASDLHEMNRRMEAAEASVTLDRTYRYAYDRPLAEVPKSGDTGKVFRHMSEASPHFQNVLRGYGVKDYERYVLTAVRSADRAGYTLYAVIYRPARQIRVLDAERRVRTLGPGERPYYRPLERDAEGRALDLVIDWAGVPRTAIKTQKGQAILMTLAANSVLINRRSDDYWDAERRWIAGDYEAVVAKRKVYLDRRMAHAE